MRIKKLPFLLCTLGMLSFLSSQSQDCGCDHTLKATSQPVTEFNGSNFTYLPGDTFCIDAAKTWNSINLVNFHGTAAKPLIFINCGGLVEINPYQYSGMAVKGCSFIRITGTGDSTLTYGIKIDADSMIKSSGMTLREKTTDVEVDHIEITRLDKGGSGLVAKTDPDCNDSTTWRPYFVFKNLHVHHNYIHQSGDEGMYIGYTGGYWTTKKVCGGKDVFGQLFENVHVHHNIVEKTGRDGIQISLVEKDLDVHDNYVHTYGRNKEYDHNFGYIFGGGNNGFVYSNIGINVDEYTNDINSRGMCMINCIPPFTMYSNVVVNCGGPGIMAANRHKMTDLTKGYYFINNTIIRPGQAGFLLNVCVPQSNPQDCQDDLDNGFYNNLIVAPEIKYENPAFWKYQMEEFFDFNTRGQRDNANISNNFMTDTIEIPLFVDTASFNYRIDSMSPARNVGKDVSAWGVTHDFDGVAFGKEDGKYDAGAFEWTSAPPPNSIKEIDFSNGSKNQLLVYPNPSDGTLNVRVSLENSKDIRLKLIDMNGAEIYSEYITEVNRGENTFEIDVPDSFKGQGFVVAFINGEVSTKMVMIK